MNFEMAKIFRQNNHDEINVKIMIKNSNYELKIEI